MASLLAEVEQRLSELVPDALKRVGSSLALTMTANDLPAGVSAWVVPLGEAPAGDTRVAGAALQKINLTFGVMFGVRVMNYRHSVQGVDELEQARSAVRDRLYGWQPQAALLPCLLGNSELANMDQSAIFWLDRYTTAVQRRAAQV